MFPTLNYDSTNSVYSASYCELETTTVVALVLGTIALVTGILTLLSTAGVPLGPLNALSHLTAAGGITLTIGGGVGLLTGLAWLVINRFPLQPEPECEFDWIPPPLPSHFSLPFGSAGAHPPVNRAYTFTKPTQLATAFDSIAFSSGHKDNRNPETLVKMSHDRRYPANYVSTTPEKWGRAGTTPYIIAATPDSGSSQQREVYNQMVLESGSRCLFSLTPSPHNNGDTSPFVVDRLEVDGKEEIYQIAPTRPIDFTSFACALETVQWLRNVIASNQIPIDPEHPLIVTDQEGKVQSAGTVILFHLLSLLEEKASAKEFTGDPDRFWRQMSYLAIHIENQTAPRSALTWIEDMNQDLDKRRNDYVQMLFERHLKARQERLATH
ncbi:MAG: hypothetical protein S4CHLAM2_08220 [Chlamydiales bacterium]|nr:hypothetical protein [Chlamydiales bacterium]